MKLFYIVFIFSYVLPFSVMASDISDSFTIGDIVGEEYAFSLEEYTAAIGEGGIIESSQVDSMRATIDGKNYIISVCYNPPCHSPEESGAIGGVSSASGPSTGGISSPGAGTGQGSNESDEAYNARLRERELLLAELSRLNSELSSLNSEVTRAESDINQAVQQRNAAATSRNLADQAAALAKALESDSKENLEKNTAEKTRLENKISESETILNERRNTRDQLVSQNQTQFDSIENEKNESTNIANEVHEDIATTVEQANSETTEIIVNSEIEELERQSEISAEERLAALLALETEYEFETPKTSEKYYNLHQVQKKIEAARALVATDTSENRPFRDSLLDSAEWAVGAADQAYAEEDSSSGDWFLNIATTAVDLATDFIPGVSAAKDAYRIWTGVDPITGEELSDVEIAMIAGSFFMPAILSGTVKGLVKLGSFASKLANKAGRAGVLGKKLKAAIASSDEAVAKWGVGSPCLVDCALGKKTGELAESLADVPKVNGKTVRNYQFAGKNYSFDLNKNPILEQRINNIKDPVLREAKKEKFAELAKKYPDGVNFNDDGFPQFDPYIFKHDGFVVEIDIKKLNPDPPPTAGGRSGHQLDVDDAKQFMREKFPGWIQPSETAWHHVEHTTKLQLLPQDIHRAVGHTGGRQTYNF